MYPRTKLFAEADAAYSTLDILVNNAAVYTFGPLESVTEEDFRRHFDTNVLSVYFTIKEAVKRFGDKGGSIINIGTAGTRSTRPNSVLYTSTKRAVDIITSTLAKELGPTPNSSELFEPRRDRHGRCRKTRNHAQLSHP